MTICRFQTFCLLHLAILFPHFSSCFNAIRNGTDEHGKPVILWRNSNDEDIVFRIINGHPAKLGDVPYQVRNTQRFFLYNNSVPRSK